MLQFIDRAIRTLLLAELRHFPMALTWDGQLTDLLSQSTDDSNRMEEADACHTEQRRGLNSECLAGANF